MSILRSRRKKPRKFDYEPRYYKPDEDPELQRRQNIKRRIRIQSKTRRGNSASLLYLLGLLAFAVWLYMNL